LRPEIELWIAEKRLMTKLPPDNSQEESAAKYQAS
jgi:hypothetical protein